VEKRARRVESKVSTAFIRPIVPKELLYPAPLLHKNDDTTDFRKDCMKFYQSIILL